MTEGIKIYKRNGELAEYDGSRIKLAISKAMIDSMDEVNEAVVDEVEEVIANMIYSDSEDSKIWSVEEISDEVESQLMDFGLHKTAKNYIIFRNERDKTRDKEDAEYGLLSKEFLSKYKHQPNPFPSALGEMVFYRTYSRWIPELKRREYWWETCKRAVEYNCSLLPNTTKDEAEK